MSAQSVTGTINSSSPNLGPYFQTNIPNHPQAQMPQAAGLLSRLWNGTQHYVYAPARHATEEAAQGLANRLSELFASNQAEVTNRVRDVFTHALLRRSPENYHRLLWLIRAFLNNPSRDDLDQIKQLLNALNGPEIRALAPGILDQGIQELTTLSALLDTDVIEQPPTGIEASPVLTAGPTAMVRLQTAEGILAAIIENHEGALVQTLNFLTQSMQDHNGPIHILRQQLNHPQHGIIAEGLATLRRDLNTRAYPPLRQSKDALEAYRSALSRSADSTELLPIIHTLHEKLQLLMERRDLVPQMIADQWLQLEQFDLQLQEILNHPEAFSPQLQLAQPDVALQIITRGFNAQRGIVEEASDILVEGIGRGMMHLEALPSRMYQNFFSPQPPIPAQPPSATTVAPSSQPAIRATDGNAPVVAEASHFLPLNHIATQGRRFLDSVLASASGAFSQQAASSLATLVRYAFEKIREHIQHTPEQNHLLGTIDPMILRLQGAIERSSWGELTGVLQSAFQFMQEQQVYLQGLRLPLNPVRTHVSAIPDFLQNINAHQNVLQPSSQRVPQTISDQDILQKVELFKSRVSSFGPAKLVLEKFCGIETNQAEYARIYGGVDVSEKDAPLIFRQRLFEKIDQTDLGFFSTMIKWWAKRVYDFILPFSSFYISSAFDNIFNHVKEGIKNPSKEEFFIDIVRNWLAVTSDAYNKVASLSPSRSIEHSPARTSRDFKLMMEEAIKSPQRNGGLKQNELYAAVETTMIDAFGPKIKWSESIDHYLKTQIPTHSPLHFLNPFVTGLNYFCSFCLKALIFVPQWIGNSILQGGSKIALNHSTLLKTFVNQNMASLHRNTPASYATRRLLYRQLQKALQLLQQNLNDEASHQDTNTRRVELTGLAEYLMEVLNKSQYHTQDRLSNYLAHRAPLRNRAGQELDETFIPEVMEQIVMTLSISLKAVTQESEMQQTLYDALCIANDSFENREPVSDEDFIAIERGIKELSDQILETTIFHAIDEKFDFTNEKQKRGIANFMGTMKEQSQTFATQIHQIIQEFSNDAASAPALVSRISSMIERSTQYNRDRVDAQGKADGNRNFHTETKYHLNELSRRLLTHCTPIAQHLNQMKTIADETAFNDKLLPPLLLSFQINQTLSQTLQNQKLSSQDLNFCNIQLLLLQKYLATLQSSQCPLPLTDAIQRYCHEHASALKKIEELQKAEGTLRAAYRLFTQLKQEKLSVGANPPSPVLKQLEKHLFDSLNTLPSADQKNQLNQQVLALMLAQNNEAVESVAARFFSLHFQFDSRNFAEENTKLDLLRQTSGALHSCFNNAIREFSHQTAINKTAIHRLCAELTTQLNTLNRWAQAQHDLPIWNLFIFDMQWVTENVKNLAFDRAQSKIKQLFESFSQRYNYLGFNNQVLFLPFLERFGKHHLKKTS